MSILSGIRKWLQESPNAISEDDADPDQAKEDLPVVEILVVHDVGTVMSYTYEDLDWGTLSPEAALARARIVQSQILYSYKTFLTRTPGMLPYLHLGDFILRLSDVVALEVKVRKGESE